MKKSDWDYLETLLKDCTVSFSKNCRSGLLPKDACQCWRCKKKRGEAVTPESEAQAAKEATLADVKFRTEQREWMRKNVRKAG